MGVLSQFGGHVGQQDPSFAAPPPEQPRSSMTDDFTASIFGDPNPGMASSSHTSLLNTTMPPFFDSSIFTGPGAHWTPPHNYLPSEDQ
jgi:hypothetical protein